MKRTFFCLMLLVVATVCAAQDTITTSTLPGGYYTSDWVEIGPNDTIGLQRWRGWDPPRTRDTVRGNDAYSQYTKDPLAVYGLAACIVTYMETGAYMALTVNSDPWTVYSHLMYIEDTSREHLLEKFRLFEDDGDTIYQVGEDLPTYLGPSNVARYIDLQAIAGNWNISWPPLPIYEVYFRDSVVVEDSFFVGRASLNVEQLPEDTVHYYYKCLTTGVARFRFVREAWDGVSSSTTFTATYVPEYTDGPYHYQARWEKDRGWESRAYTLFFPIVTPGKARDTTGVVEADNPLDYNTTLSPNPASGRVRVASGFGLSHIEVFDLAGTRVLDLAAQGLTASFDVDGWP